MGNQLYTDLLHSISVLHNLDEAEKEAFQSTGGMWMGDVYFYLLEDDEPDADTVGVYCVFGMPPPERESEVLRAMLQENAAMFLYSGPTFMINSQDGNVLLAHRYPLSTATPEDMLNMMEFVATEALKWRETFYLEDSPVNMAESQTSLSHSFV